MFLQELSLQNFRSYKKKSFDFSNKTTLIVGPNARGKTNILEAIYVLSRGKSFRAERTEEMIAYGEELARVEGSASETLRSPRDNLRVFDSLREKTHREDGASGRSQTKTSKLYGAPRVSKLGVILTTGQVQGKKTAKKLFKVNGVGRRWRDFVGNLKVVLFRPEDIEIILGSPSIRRDYLDSVLELVDNDYRRCNLAYKKGLRQRNRLLDKIREGEAQRTQLEFWNRLLVKNGEIISRKREELVEIFNFQFSIFNFLRKNLTIEYDKSVISPARLEKYAQAELALGATLVGPQRDDIKFKIRNEKLKIAIQNSKLENGKDLSLFGSRGEQRMAVLALKLAELEFVKQKSGEQPAFGFGHSTRLIQPCSMPDPSAGRPVLLLDDIFSELDEEHRRLVLKIVGKQQTIITTTDKDLVAKDFLDRIVICNL